MTGAFVGADRRPAPPAERAAEVASAGDARELLASILEIAPARVANRPGARSRARARR
jgi:hypothetical protein